MKLNQMVKINDWDDIKINHHDMWTPQVHSLIKKYFGSISIDDNVNNNPDINNGIELFTGLYVVDYDKHIDEIEDLSKEQLLSFIDEGHINCYSEIIAWSQKGQKRKISVDINKQMYEDCSESRILVDNDPNLTGKLLCGRRGSGKTSLIQYNIDLQKRIQKYIYIKVVMNKGSLGNPNVCSYLKEQIIWEIDQMINELVPEVNDQYIVDRYAFFWKGIAGNLTPSEDDSPNRSEEKRKSRDNYLQQQLITTKYTTEFPNYLKNSIYYLEKITNKRVVLVIDDIDHLESSKDAREIIGEAANIQEKVKRPLIIAVREETISKINAKPSVDKFERIHVTPPSFKKVLQLRLEALIKEVRSIDLDTAYYSKSDFITYVNTIISSVIDKNVYSRLITFHYDIDMLLDMTRCLLSSPYLPPKMVLYRASQGKNIGWHFLLNSFQKYVYRNHYQLNSFFLNMYDNRYFSIDPQADETLVEISWENVLIRSRLLAVMANKLTQKITPSNEYPAFVLRYIIDDMKDLGYSENETMNALRAFAAHRIIRTGRVNNELDGLDSKISISTAVIFYFDYLIYEYRYLQNILPITPIDFKFNIDDIPDSPESKDIYKIDGIINDFANFIERCEKLEKEKMPNPQSIDKIWKGLTLSARIRKVVSDFRYRRSHK